MELRGMLRNKIVDEVLGAYHGNWAMLVYDSPVAHIIQPLFTKSDFLSYGVMISGNIEEERETWDFPVVYFLNATDENVAIINKEFKEKKYSAFCVCTLVEPCGLDPLIKARVVVLNMQVLEERVFLCPPDDLISISHVLGASFSINYLPSMQEVASALEEKCKASEGSGSPGHSDDSSPGTSNAFMLLIDREVDLFTPLLHFFTFKSALIEMGEKDFNDVLFPELRYKHLANVSDALQHNINKLNRNAQALNKEKIDTASLSRLVVDAPKNIEIKEAVQKYTNLLNEAIKKLEYLKDLVEAEQIVATDFDKKGKRARKNLDYFFDILESSKFSFEDRLRLLFLIKAKGVKLTKTEQSILENCGFQKKHIEAQIDTGSQIRRVNQERYVYDVSRYEPILTDLVTGFLGNKPIFQRLGAAPTGVDSLRKSSMLTVGERAPKRIIVAYIRGGLTDEECRIAYTLSESLGIELFVGSDRMMTPMAFIEGFMAASK